MSIAVGIDDGDPARTDVPSVLVERTSSHSAHTILSFEDGANGLSLNPSASKVAVSLQIFQGRSGVSPTTSALASGLWVIDLHTKRLQELYSGYIGHVSWAPNGNSIAFITQADTLGAPALVESISASGGTPTVIARLPPAATSSDVTDLQWSSNSQELLVSYWHGSVSAVTTESGVVLVTVGTGTVRWELPQQQADAYLGATFSPDGRSVAVLSVSESGPLPNQVTLNQISSGHPVHPIATFPGQPQLVGWF
jgi:Tol biopolymer transport system component